MPGALIVSLVLSGCGPHLGNYRYENVGLVDRAALDALDLGDYPLGPSPDLLRVEFSSEEDLESASGGSGSGLYVKADFCPFSDEYGVTAFGPYYNDRSPYTLLNRTERALPGGGVAIEGEQRHPSRDPRTNRYVYTTYVVPSQPVRSGAQGEAREAYDLRAGVRDLCLRIDHPGYYLTPSRSGIFVIPGAAVAAALQRTSPSSGAP
jgi:hypothetical protein